MSARLLFIVSVLSLGACQAEISEPDGSVATDAPGAADAGGLLDSWVPPRDASAADAGPAFTCETTPCDPRSPDGCSSGSCVLWSAAASCESASGAVAAGAPCTAVTDCAPGLACFASSDGGVCGRVCCPGDVEACTAGAICGGSGTLVDGSRVTWGRCLPPRSCGVLSPGASCEEREGCYIVGIGQTECRVAGTATAGEACAVQEDCQSGFFCGALDRCVRICRIGGDECPTEEGRCIAQMHSPEGTGFCTLDAASARGS